nr:hypothetical protein TgIa.1100 [Toxoplasma gondii RH]
METSKQKEKTSSQTCSFAFLRRKPLIIRHIDALKVESAFCEISLLFRDRWCTPFYGDLSTDIGKPFRHNLWCFKDYSAQRSSREFSEVSGTCSIGARSRHVFPPSERPLRPRGVRSFLLSPCPRRRQSSELPGAVSRVRQRTHRETQEASRENDFLQPWRAFVCRRVEKFRRNLRPRR